MQPHPIYGLHIEIWGTIVNSFGLKLGALYSTWRDGQLTPCLVLGIGTYGVSAGENGAIRKLEHPLPGGTDHERVLVLVSSASSGVDISVPSYSAEDCANGAPLPAGWTIDLYRPERIGPEWSLSTIEHESPTAPTTVAILGMTETGMRTTA